MIRALSLAALFGLLTAPAMAAEQTYTVSLGSRQLGTLQFEGERNDASLLLSLNNAPFGLKNGTFKAVARSTGGKVDYLGQNRGSETRDIAIGRKADKVTSVSVAPPSEMTEMTEAGKVPSGVVFPPEFFAAVANSTTCPSPIAMYDGRRVVRMAATAMEQDGETVFCDMSYRVTMGPGYVSPFHFRKFGVELAYSAGKLVKFTLKAGGFKVHLNRQ
ncbi:hypothetical protein [Sulfitobacter delicatus]|uniref:DUF3108 domain-containing protein n=1 Tax=Sulfitobacter delicatus TaxID=218672 RepID=A0A1G7YFP0_9RHOB|nr:hypothetical protein [Sulfitobacter delicatus]SDG95253.1 hypothetical protein SAMN04489759_11533 [Sulfitobacter delicatus]